MGLLCWAVYGRRQCRQFLQFCFLPSRFGSSLRFCFRVNFEFLGLGIAESLATETSAACFSGKVCFLNVVLSFFNIFRNYAGERLIASADIVGSCSAELRLSSGTSAFEESAATASATSSSNAFSQYFRARDLRICGCGGRDLRSSFAERVCRDPRRKSNSRLGKRCWLPFAGKQRLCTIYRPSVSYAA